MMAKKLNYFLLFGLYCLYFPVHAQVNLAYDTESAPLEFAVNQLREVLSSQNNSLVTYHFQQLDEAPDIGVILPGSLPSWINTTTDFSGLKKEGFRIENGTNGQFIAAEPSSSSAHFDRSSPFISIIEWMDHETLDPALLSIKDFGRKLQANEPVGAGLITPIELANEIEKDCMKALTMLEDLQLMVNSFSGAFKSEIEDLITWSYLGFYMADKIRAGVALNKFQHSGNPDEKEIAIDLLQHCLSHWDKVIHYTKDRYRAVPHVSTEHYDSTYTLFSWELLRPQVVRDIELAQHLNKKNN